MVDVDQSLRRQIGYLADHSPWYRERIGALVGRVRGVADLPELPLMTKEEVRAGQRDDPPFGPHLCAPRERLVRMHVTSGTTGDPVAIGLTKRDHEANGTVGGEAFRIAGARPEDTIAHCLNYTLYAGGVADHMALEASGATVVPIGVGQSRRLIELIPVLRVTAIFGTLSFPLYLANRARELGVEPRSLGLRHLITAGEPGRGLAAVRREIETVWGATVADTFGMSDVWSTMGGACGQGEGLHLTTGGWAVVEWLPRTRASRSRCRTARRGSWCGRTYGARRHPCCATARPTSRRSGRRRARAGAPRRESPSTAAATTCCACAR
jgi:phenylacetate-CoA ligase